MKKSTLKIFKGVGYFSVFILLVFLFLLFRLDVLPLKYFVLISLTLLVIDFFFVFAIHKMKKPLKILGFVMTILLSFISIVGIYYTYNTDAFLNRSFRSGKLKLSTNYYVAVLNNYGASSLNELDGSVSYLNGAYLIEEAINNLSSQKKFEMNSYDDALTMFHDLKEGTISSILVEQTSYDLVMSLNQGFQASDFKVIYNFEVVVEVDNTANASESGKYQIYIGGNDFTNSLMDFNMIITINQNSHRILMTSLPRDYYIPVTGYNGRKDTLSFMGARGIDTNRKSLEEFLGLQLDYYIKINTKSLVGIVDEVGGIDYCSNMAYTTTHAMILDTYDDSKGQRLYVRNGCQHLNGIQTLTVARERLAFKGGDRQRQKNCQEIIKAIFKQLVSTNTITNYNNILSALADLYETNIPKEMITDFVKETIDGAQWKIEEQSVNGTDSNNYVHLTTNIKSYVMEPDMATVDAAKTKMNEVLNS